MKRSKFSISRCNASTIERHRDSVHKSEEKIDVISYEDPRAAAILKEQESDTTKRYKINIFN